MITLRLDSKLEQLVNNTAKNLGITKSQLIRNSILLNISYSRQKEIQNNYVVTIRNNAIIIIRRP
jgi:predicted DNA-binding protein